MIKNEIINDMNFRRKCSKIGLDWEDAEVYGDVILVNAPQKYIYMLYLINIIMLLVFIRLNLRRYILGKMKLLMDTMNCIIW